MLLLILSYEADPDPDLSLLKVDLDIASCAVGNFGGLGNGRNSFL